VFIPGYCVNKAKIFRNERLNESPTLDRDRWMLLLEEEEEERRPVFFSRRHAASAERFARGSEFGGLRMHRLAYRGSCDVVTCEDRLPWRDVSPLRRYGRYRRRIPAEGLKYRCYE
jgi:hypothetical protein